MNRAASHANGDYRPALDGIRAVAVLAVFAYHLGYRWLQGGFAGVDVFFVLSGYLITGLLLAERERTGRIDLGQFWLRRARRLLPALLLLLAAVAIWIAITALPFEFEMRRADLLWTLFYGANWHFIASGQDYFAQFASASPLRHAWSLAIEEQFYILWPLIVLTALVTLPRGFRFLAAICIGGAIASTVAMAVLYDPGDPSRAYYGTDARIHQLFIGALLAVGLRKRPRQSGGITATIIGVAASALLLTAFVFLSDRNPGYYRGLSAALALVTAGLIWSVETAPSNVVAKGLSWTPARWIGQLSYGLYLWHWPVILAVTSAPWFLAGLPGSSGMNLARVILTGVITVISFTFLERPIRQGRMPAIGASTRRFATAATLSVVVLLGVILLATRPPATAPGEISECPSSGTAPCLRFEGPSGAPVVAVVGDSIARSLDASMLALARQRGWTYVLGAANACRITRLMTSYEGQVRPMDRECFKSTPQRLDRVLDEWNPAVIVALDRWEVIDIATPSGAVLAAATPEHIAATEAALVDTSRHLTSKGAHLLFVELPPVLPKDCGRHPDASTSRCEVPIVADPVQDPYNAIFRRLGGLVPRVSTMSITPTICPNDRCPAIVDGVLLRFDGVHFTDEARQILAPALERQILATGAIGGPVRGPSQGSTR